MHHPSEMGRHYSLPVEVAFENARPLLPDPQCPLVYKVSFLSISNLFVEKGEEGRGREKNHCVYQNQHTFNSRPKRSTSLRFLNANLT